MSIICNVKSYLHFSYTYPFMNILQKYVYYFIPAVRLHYIPCFLVYYIPILTLLSSYLLKIQCNNYNLHPRSFWQYAIDYFAIERKMKFRFLHVKCNTGYTPWYCWQKKKYCTIVLLQCYGTVRSVDHRDLAIWQ